MKVAYLTEIVGETHITIAPISTARGLSYPLQARILKIS